MEPIDMMEQEPAPPSADELKTIYRWNHPGYQWEGPRVNPMKLGAIAKNGFTLLYKKAHRHGHGGGGLVARIRSQKTNATHRCP
jgi:hypothetical protein